MATADIVEVKKDRFEELADFYTTRMRIDNAKLAEARAEFEETLNYSALLRMESLVEQIRYSMTCRTAMRTHSESFRQRYPENTASWALDVI